ncbi:MAG TPA: DsbA family protein [Micromonosporaceae bacterium]|nr:DsbA family protein [Micromonosporaceae bacterium]
MTSIGSASSRGQTADSASASGIRRRIGWIGPLLVLAVVAVLAALSAPHTKKPAPIAGDRGAAEPSEQEEAANPFAPLIRRQEGDPLALGRVDAPVVIIEYADFQCPYCARFARQTVGQLKTEYVDRGLVRIEWRDLPILGPESETAAAAARAAGAQGRFWEYHDALYAEDRRVNSGALTDAALRAIAADLGLDLARFDLDRDSGATRAALARDEQEAIALGITGTPAFIVDDTPVIGAQPYEEFKRIIDAALAKR